MKIIKIILSVLVLIVAGAMVWSFVEWCNVFDRKIVMGKAS